MMLVIKVNDDDGVSDIFLLMSTIVLWLLRSISVYVFVSLTFQNDDDNAIYDAEDDGDDDDWDYKSK